MGQNSNKEEIGLWVEATKENRASLLVGQSIKFDPRASGKSDRRFATGGQRAQDVARGLLCLSDLH